MIRDAGSLSGLPMMVAGVGLMIFGWRLWRFCVVLSYGLIAVGACLNWVPPDLSPTYYAIAAGILVGAISYLLASYAISVLGGLVGFGCVWYFMASILHLQGPMGWIISGVAFCAATAMSVLYRNHMVIFVTSFLGAVLFMAGLTAVLAVAPSMYGTFRSMASTSAIVIPFMVLVPTVMSFFYQVSEVHRLRAE